MKIETSLSTRLSQQMKLAPQVIQSIEILQLPIMALVEQVQQELSDNPVLEEVVDERKDNQDSTQGDESDNSSDNDEAYEKEFERLGEMADEWREYFAQTNIRRSNAAEERDQKQDALENTAMKSISLQDYLLGQLSMVEIDDSLIEICENIIYNINDSGYLSYSLEEAAKTLEKPVSIDDAKEALKIVQNMEPPGVGARNLKECLLLQLDQRDANYSTAKELISNYLEDVETKKYKLIAKKSGLNLETVKQVIEFIKTLNPKPGSIFNNEQIPYITPEVRVDYVDEKYEVTLVGNNNLPRIYISSFYKDELTKKGGDLNTKNYIRKKIESARWLIDAIEQRKSTLYKVAVKIVELQKKFLDEGILKLQTLKMQDVADAVGIHVSTVSRAIAHKYMQTPQGIFDMKFFFTGGFMNDNGVMESWEAMRQKLAKIINDENKAKPLSDEEVAAELGKMGVEIARRTVTKYRRSMKIPSSRKRREC
ncbi:MAG: RNA polymerase sigma-54 factor [Candidatus Scalindua sp. AMX11]|nr:MAG: RNA polymerase sigma-54 factor [Candidatus Scalindua sp.]NOG85191.1 RNA polymerase factor sigma-54 [Planctomycetota bacterium]RZV64321.1 MAG: RNA polymerase sigma-54 factor [Candidatus Scalindua sp. SCAELEC01]TDE63435.1 MAG: RNA polymerase sigma-54 factor [Candidatus Scalindua sp. AMX11]GJQ57311.1 MAG: RNA polymerase sigma-54 factor [Candidatus Scalindua sp.]